MKNRKIKLIASLVLASLLFSCSTTDNVSDGKETDGAVKENTNESATEAEDGTKPSGKVFASAEVTDYKLIRPDVAKDENEVEAFKTVNKALSGVGLTVNIDTDFAKRGVDPDSLYEKEILIGLTNRTASEEAHAKLSEGEFIIGIYGERLVCVGYTPEITEVAAEYLVLNFIDENGLILPEEGFEQKYKAGVDVSTKTVKNPIAQGADPWVVRDGDDYYYCYSNGDNIIMVGRADSLDTIDKAVMRTVYTAPQNTMYSHNYWSPELHKINGEWYIYVAADDGNDWNHRMYVLKATTDDPTKPFKMVGKLTDKTDKWAIDGTVMAIGKDYYFVWSGWVGNYDIQRDLYMAKMLSPTELDEKRTVISIPTHDWEKHYKPFINEGPTGLVKDGKAYILYAASGSGTDEYCFGLLTLEGDDPMARRVWVKSKEPILKSSSDFFGPGHCAIVEEKDGSLWAVYHAQTESNAGWQGRKIFIQEIIWKDGLPAFEGGVPAKEVKLPVVKYDASKSVEVE